MPRNLSRNNFMVLDDGQIIIRPENTSSAVPKTHSALSICNPEWTSSSASSTPAKRHSGLTCANPAVAVCEIGPDKRMRAERLDPSNVAVLQPDYQGTVTIHHADIVICNTHRPAVATTAASVQTEHSGLDRRTFPTAPVPILSSTNDEEDCYFLG